MDNVNLSGLEDAISAANELLKTVKDSTRDLNKAFEQASGQAEQPQAIQMLQAKVNRLINKALTGVDVTADINTLINESKNIK